LTAAGSDPHAEKLVPAVTLMLSASGGAFAIFTALLEITVGHTEGAETALFILAFGVLLPLSLAGVHLFATGKAGPLGPSALPAVAAVSAFGLVAALGMARGSEALTSGPGGPGLLLALLGGWLAVTVLAAREPLLGALRSLAPGLWSPRGVWAPAVAIPALIVIFCSPSPPGAGSVLVSLLIGACLLGLDAALRSAGLGPRAVLVADVMAVALILLTVSDVWVYTTYSATQPDPDLGGGELLGWVAQHHNVFLGAANDVLHGRVVLVDTFSQYGVGNIYALAAVFSVVPIGYGTFGLFVAGTLALLYALGYAILRLTGCSQLTAAAALAGTVISSGFYPLGAASIWPSVGAQRYWLAYALILLAVLSARRPGWARPLSISMVALVGVSSIWSFEAFLYCAVTFAAIAGYGAAVRPSRGGFLPSLADSLGRAALAVVAAHALLALTTVAVSGELPHWGTYAAFLAEYSTGARNKVPATDWWPGILFAGFFFASAVALAALLRVGRSFEASNRAALVAMVGLVAFGTVSFTYPLRFSFDDAVLRQDLAAFMLGALWIHLAQRSGAAIPRLVRAGTAAVGFWLVGWFAVLGWDHLTRKVDHTPMVQLLPGHDPYIDQDLRRTWRNPPIDPRSVEADRLLDQYWPGQSRALVLIQPDLGVETLLRGDRINLLPVSDVYMDDFIWEDTVERVLPAIERLRPRTLMLTERFYLTPGARRDYLAPNQPMLPLERVMIRHIRQRFRLDPILATSSDLMVVRLMPRDSAPHG
jgi:hypothetical protein